MRRRLMTVSTLLVACASVSQAFAQTYPNRAIRFVVPYAPGGGVSVYAQLVGTKLSDIVKQPVVIENRAGAGGNVGADVVAKATPDGYTVLIHTSALASAGPLYKSLPFDPVKDFAPVTNVVATQMIVSGSLKAHRSRPASARWSEDSEPSAPRGRRSSRMEAIGHAHLHQLEIGSNKLELGSIVAADSWSSGTAARRYTVRLRSTTGACGEPASTSACTFASVLKRKCGATCACSTRNRASSAWRSSSLRSSANVSVWWRAKVSFWRTTVATAVQGAIENGGEPDEHPVVVFEEGQRSWGGGPAVHHEHRDRHSGADGHDLENPSLDPPRQSSGPHLEE